MNLCNVGEFYLNLADCEGSITVGKSGSIGSDMSLGLKGSKGRGNLIYLDKTNVEMSRGWECWANLYILDATNVEV